MKDKLKNNPILFKDSRVSVLDDAYGVFMDIIEEYAIKNNVSDESLKELRSLIEEAYQDKKIEYFLDYKFDGLGEKVENFVDLALNSPNKRASYTNLFYIKHTNHFISNE
jgi:hypothetical protein